MTRLRRLLLAATLLAPLPALAVTEPAPGPKDSRVRSTVYDPLQVVRATSTGLTPLQFVFEAGEKAVMISGMLVQVIGDKGEVPGDAKDWLAKRSGNVLILQPLRQVEPSMLFVRTVSADGHERPYAFELRTREGSMTDEADKAAYMMVQFAYKPTPTPEAIAAWRARREQMQAAATERVVQAKFARSQAANRNYAYEKRDPEGCPLLAPVYAFDDGIRTTLIFAPHATLPEVYTINQDGKEAITTTINETLPTGLQVVVPTVQREMRLRRGGKVCALRNNAFDLIGREPGNGSGTVSPDVVRQVRAP